MAILFLANSNAYCTQVETVAEIYPSNPDMSGIAVTKDDRIFLGFPRHADNHNYPALAEYKDGKLVPFPDKRTAMKGKNPAMYLVSPHGMTVDALGRLWVVDNGKLAGVSEIQNGAAKVVCFNVNHNSKCL